MLGLGFLNPLLLWGLPLASVPIIIHLLNRRRFQKVRWAAMEFLLAALKRNRKRLQMEQWLVLLLRTLVILLLVLLVTRPQLSGTVLGDVRTHHVVCLDDSASMAQREGTTTAFRKGLDRVVGLVEQLADTREGDLFTLLRASTRQRPDLAAVRIGPQLPRRIREVLAGFTPGDGILDPGALLEQARKRVADTAEASRSEIHFITDLRRVDWQNADGKPNARVLRQIQALDPEHQRVSLVSVSPQDCENLGVVDVRHGGRVAVVRVGTEIQVTVQNHGLSPSAPVQLALDVDTRSRVVQTVEQLQPGEKRVLTFAHTFQTDGHHGITASLPADRFPVDDRRSLAMHVAASSDVLLVDGDPGDRPEEAETYFLAAALEHPESGISVQVIPDHTLADQDLDTVDMIFLCNVPTPTTEVVEKLEAYVAAGGGLAIFLGDQVDPVRYNEVLYRDGNGLLPSPLGDLVGDMDRPQPVFVADTTHGTMAVATELVQTLLANFVLVGRYIEILEPKGGTARTILRVGSAEGTPLMTSRHFRDGGEVMLVGTTADIHWSSWPKSPAFLIVTQQMHQVAARVHDQGRFNLGPEGIFELELDAARYRAEVAVSPIEGDGMERTFTATAPAAEQPATEQPSADLVAKVRVPMSDLAGTGLFEVALMPHVGDRERLLITRNPPTVEGQLQRLTGTGWQRVYPAEIEDRVEIIEGSGSAATLQAGFGEVWRLLALLMLAALMVESLLAWRFGRR